MAQWESVLSHPAVREVYESLKDPMGAAYFPIELRHFFAQFIETQPWHHIDCEDPSHVSNARIYVNLLFNELTRKIQELTVSANADSFVLKRCIEEMNVVLKRRYAAEPQQLVRVLQLVLQQERDILASGRAAAYFHGGGNSFSSTSYGTDATKLNDASLNAEIERLQEHAQSGEAKLHELLQRQEYLIIQHQEWDDLNAALSGGAAAKMTPAQRTQVAKQARQKQELIAHEGSQIMLARRSILEVHGAALEHSGRVLGVLLEKLQQWQSAQRKKTMAEEYLREVLAVMHLQFEALATFYYSIRQQLRQHEVQREQLRCGDEDGAPSLDQLFQAVHDQLETLVRASFVVVTQPPQVMKTASKFTASVRILVGSRFSMGMAFAEVVCQIINEEQAQQLHAHNTLAGNAGELLNAKQIMSPDPSATLQASFNNLTLKKIRRKAAKVAKKEDVVTEEKFALVFTTSFSIGELTYKLWALSVPVVAIVHIVQTTRASATVFWDVSFGKTQRLPWEVPVAVRWPKFAAGLSHYWQLVHGAPLTGDALNFLGSKILGPGEDMVSWSRFNREPMPSRLYSFWEWFLAICDLVKKHLSAPWAAGLIAGFITKNYASELLAQCQKGTFLMRFSDSELGGVSVSWTVVEKNGQARAYHLQPWFEKDLAIRSLPDRIRDLKQLQWLYPDVPKDDAFQSYYSSTELSLEGDYVRTTISAAIVNDDDSGGGAAGDAAGGADVMDGAFGDFAMQSVYMPGLSGMGAGRDMGGSTSPAAARAAAGAAASPLAAMSMDGFETWKASERDYGSGGSVFDGTAGWAGSSEMWQGGGGAGASGAGSAAAGGAGADFVSSLMDVGGAADMSSGGYGSGDGGSGMGSGLGSGGYGYNSIDISAFLTPESQAME